MSDNNSGAGNYKGLPWKPIGMHLPIHEMQHQTVFKAWTDLHAYEIVECYTTDHGNDRVLLYDTKQHKLVRMSLTKIMPFYENVNA